MRLKKKTISPFQRMLYRMSLDQSKRFLKRGMVALEWHYQFQETGDLNYSQVRPIVSWVCVSPFCGGLSPSLLGFHWSYSHATLKFEDFQNPHSQLCLWLSEPFSLYQLYKALSYHTPCSFIQWILGSC